MNEEVFQQNVYSKEIFYSKELISLLEESEKDGSLGGDAYETLQHARGYRSCLYFPDGFIILDERYEKRISRKGHIIIKYYDDNCCKRKTVVCNDKAGIEFVPAWNGEQHFRQ